jgi:hypothetical protein
MAETFLGYNANAQIAMRLASSSALIPPKLFNISPKQSFLAFKSINTRYNGNFSQTSISEKILISKGFFPEFCTLRNFNYDALYYTMDMEPQNYFTLDESPDGIIIETDYMQSFTELGGVESVASIIEDALRSNMKSLPRFI